MAFKPTSRVIPVDMDGNRLALFHGYDAPTPADLFAAYPNAAKIMVYNRKGEITEVKIKA